MIGLVVTMLSDTQTFAMQHNYPTFIDGQDVKVPVRYLRKMLSSNFKEIQPGVRRFEVVRKTLDREKM